MATDKQIFIHAGAHRTGTSSFQECLSQNRAVLEAAGFDLAYPGRDGADGGTLALRLPSPRHGRSKQALFTERVARTVQDHSPDPGRALILSEENIPGSMLHFRKGQFYPAGRNRFTALRQGMGVDPAHLVFVVRDYARIFESGYRKRAEDNKVDPFDAATPRILAMKRGWPDLIVLMRNLIVPRRMTVVRYEARGSSVDLLRLLVPALQQTALREPDKVVNLSATDAALEALQARYTSGETLSRAQWKAIVEEHADDKEDRGFAKYPKDVRAVLDARYARDLDRIAKMEGIDFI